MKTYTEIVIVAICAAMASTVIIFSIPSGIAFAISESNNSQQQQPDIKASTI
jgi:hypothetical protein